MISLSGRRLWVCVTIGFTSFLIIIGKTAFLARFRGHFFPRTLHPISEFSLFFFSFSFVYRVIDPLPLSGVITFVKNKNIKRYFKRDIISTLNSLWVVFTGCNIERSRRKVWETIAGIKTIVKVESLFRVALRVISNFLRSGRSEMEHDEERQLCHFVRT